MSHTPNIWRWATDSVIVIEERVGETFKKLNPDFLEAKSWNWGKSWPVRVWWDFLEAESHLAQELAPLLQKITSLKPLPKCSFQNQNPSLSADMNCHSSVSLEVSVNLRIIIVHSCAWGTKIPKTCLNNPCCSFLIHSSFTVTGIPWYWMYGIE